MVILDKRIRGVPVHEMGPDLFRFRIQAPEGDIELVAVISHQAVCIDGRGDVVARRPLVKELHDRGLLPCFFVEDAVDLDLRRSGGEGENGGGRLFQRFLKVRTGERRLAEWR